MLSNALSSCGAAATNHEVAGSDMADDDTPLGEWECEIVEEVIDEDILKYMVAWVPTLKPGDTLSLALKEVWEAKKAAMLAPRGDGKRSSGTQKQRIDPNER